MNQKFDEGEIVYFDHPGFGKGYGIVVGYTASNNNYHICPSKNNRNKNIIICISSELISTPF